MSQTSISDDINDNNISENNLDEIQNIILKNFEKIEDSVEKLLKNDSKKNIKIAELNPKKNIKCSLSIKEKEFSFNINENEKNLCFYIEVKNIGNINLPKDCYLQASMTNNSKEKKIEKIDLDLSVIVPTQEVKILYIINPNSFFTKDDNSIIFKIGSKTLEKNDQKICDDDIKITLKGESNLKLKYNTTSLSGLQLSIDSNIKTSNNSNSGLYDK